MPKKSPAKKSSTLKVERQVAKMNEHMNAMLVIFALAMLMLAFVLVKVYTV